MVDLGIIINIEIIDECNINILIKDNYDREYLIKEDSKLKDCLNKLFESNINKPVGSSFVSNLKRQVESFCIQYKDDLTPHEFSIIQHTVPSVEIKKDEVPHEIKSIIKIIESYKDKYTKQEQKYILNKITNAIRKVDDCCMDNFRFSDGSVKSLIEYGEIKAHGCCGFYDDEIKLKSGKTFMFGFNYGH